MVDQILRAVAKASFFFIVLLFPAWVLAQAQQATVVNNGALVYKEADFDAPVLTQLKSGGVYSISKGKKGPFYKIRVKPGSIGWIADSDVKLGVVKVEEEPEPVNLDEEIKKKHQKPFFASRYRGPVFEYLFYEEDTLGRKRSEGLLFYGLKINGFDTLFDGEIYTDTNILFHVGAPKYYAEETGESADGYIVIANFLLQTITPKSKWHFYYYGLGPTVKYSHFNLHLPNGTSQSSYSADDLTIGLVFNLGLAFRLSETLSLKTDVKYYWEKTQYLGAGVNLGFIF
ncbi:hypothetical protein D3C87_163060 [compost metagenome]